MAKRKVQVTLDETQYEALARIAERQGRKLAAVVRESIERYCLGPEARRARQEALDDLFALEAPVPREWADWKSDYSRRKTENEGNASDGSREVRPRSPTRG